MTTLGLIGGSGFDQLDDFIVNKKQELGTPYGSPSADLIFGSFCEQEIVFLPRHGVDHSIPPHRINYRANIFALKSLGISEIIALAAVGGIAADCKPETIVIPDQVIDYSWGREHTYYDGVENKDDVARNKVEHIDFTQPFDDNLRQRVISAAESAGLSFNPRGVYAVTQGPRLETAAEIDRLERDGADVVGMTVMPEAALARELGIAYVCIALVVNQAAGRGDQDLTMETIFANLAIATQDALALLTKFE